MHPADQLPPSQVRQDGPFAADPDPQRRPAQLPGYPAPPGFQAFLEVKTQTASLDAPPHPHRWGRQADPLPCSHLLPTGSPSETETPRRVRRQPLPSRGHTGGQPLALGHLCSPWEERLAAQALHRWAQPQIHSSQVQKALEQKTFWGKFVAAILGNMTRSEGMSNYLKFYLSHLV